MLQTESQHQHSRHDSAEGSPYATGEDWWYDHDTGTESAKGHSELAGTTRAEYVAHQVLKQDATLLDPVALNEPPDRGVAPLFEYLFDEPSGGPSDPAALHSENELVAVSEPAEYVPKEHMGRFSRIDYNQFSKRWRVSEEYGYLCRGPVIADRPAGEFMAVVGGVLDAAQQAGYRDFAPGEKEAIRERAFRMKADSGGPHDTTIMEEVIRCIDTPGRASEDSGAA